MFKDLIHIQSWYNSISSHNSVSLEHNNNVYSSLGESKTDCVRAAWGYSSWISFDVALTTNYCAEALGHFPLVLLTGIPILTSWLFTDLRQSWCCFVFIPEPWQRATNSWRKLPPFLNGLQAGDLSALSISSAFVISLWGLHTIPNRFPMPFSRVLHNDSRVRACSPSVGMRVKASDVRSKGTIFISASGKQPFVCLLW